MARLYAGENCPTERGKLDDKRERIYIFDKKRRWDLMHRMLVFSIRDTDSLSLIAGGKVDFAGTNAGRWVDMGTTGCRSSLLTVSVTGSKVISCV